MKSFFVAIAIALSVGTARADNKIVLESFTGGKSEAAARQLEPLLGALAAKGFTGGYEAVGRAYETRISRRAIPDGLPADFAGQVEAGSKAFFAGKFEDAVHLLAPLVDAAHTNSGAFAQNQGGLGDVERAMILLALSQQRANDPGSMQQTFAELIRSFPKTSVPRGTYGSEAAAAFDNAKKAALKAGTGKLVVRSSVDTGVIFVNEQIKQAGSVTLDDAPIGDYRVFVLLPGKQLSRVHRVTVRSKETSSLTIDAELDVVVQTSPTWTGLAFATAADREKLELEIASRFATDVDATAVAIVGIDQVRGKPAIVGSLVNRNRGTEIRRASVALEPAPSAERLVALAEFLTGDTQTPPEGVDVVVEHRPRTLGAGVDREPVESRGWGGWKYVTGGLALAAIGTGAYLLSLDGTCPTEVPSGTLCPNLYNTAVPAYLTLGGGVALAGVTLYLFVRGSSSSNKTAFVAPARGGAIASFSMRF